MSADSKLIIVEMVASANFSPSEAYRDLTLLAYVDGGRIRSEGEFRQLLAGTAFNLKRVIPTVGPFAIAGFIRIAGRISILECEPG